MLMENLAAARATGSDVEICLRGTLVGRKTTGEIRFRMTKADAIKTMNSQDDRLREPMEDGYTEVMSRCFSSPPMVNIIVGHATGSESREIAQTFPGSKVFFPDGTYASYAVDHAIAGQTPSEAVVAATKHLVDTKKALGAIDAKRSDAEDKWWAAMMDLQHAEKNASLSTPGDSSKSPQLKSCGSVEGIDGKWRQFHGGAHS